MILDAARGGVGGGRKGSPDIHFDTLDITKQPAWNRATTFTPKRHHPKFPQSLRIFSLVRDMSHPKVAPGGTFNGDPAFHDLVVMPPF